MVVVGVDADKRTHTLVGVDEAGQKLGEKDSGRHTRGAPSRQWDGRCVGPSASSRSRTTDM